MSSRKQSLISIGLGLIIVGAILIVFALSQPRKSIEELTTISSTEQSESNVSETSQLISADNSSVVSSTQSTYNDTQTQGEVSVTYPLDLNNCTQLELMSINGIGETRANAIIQYREYLGGYTSVEQLKEIKGIGDSTFAKIQPYVTV